MVEETVEQGVEANNDKERDERKFVKAKRRKGSVGWGLLVQARINDFLKLCGNQETIQGISKKRQVADLGEKLNPGNIMKKK